MASRNIVDSDEVINGFIANYTGEDREQVGLLLRGAYTAGYAVGRMSVTGVEQTTPPAMFPVLEKLLHTLSARDLYLVDKYGMTSQVVMERYFDGELLPQEAISLAMMEQEEKA